MEGTVTKQTATFVCLLLVVVLLSRQKEGDYRRGQINRHQLEI